MAFLKIKAGALQFTLFIAVVVALLLFAFILFVQTHKKFNIQTNYVIETANLAQMGIEYALLNAIKANDTTTVDLNQKDYETLKIHKSYWGVFEKLMSVASIKNNSFKKVSLVGGQQLDFSNRTCLFLKETNRPLIVVGSTHIEGVAQLSESGIKPGTIAGHSYYGNQLIYGSVRLSRVYPSLPDELLNQLKSINTINFTDTELIAYKHGIKVKNSFLSPRKVIFDSSDIRLTNVTLTGNIIIQSNTKIIVENNALLNDVLLIAPSIVIKDRVKGKFQAIASKTIIVDNEVELKYPSALVLIKKRYENYTNNKINNPTENNQIHIGSNTTIHGVVLFNDMSVATNHNSQVLIDKNSVIHGEVYCNRNIELKGRVYGTVYTANFLTRNAGSVYQNHLFNTEINVNKLSEFYVGLPLVLNPKSVVKWLY